MTIPTVDPRVKYRGTSYLRELNADTLRTLEGVVLIQGVDLELLAVIVPIHIYLAMQDVVLDSPPVPMPKREATNGTKKTSKRDAVIQERAASDVTAQAVAREDVDYSDLDSTPTTHVASLDAVAPSTPGMGKASVETWREKRRKVGELSKPKDRK